MCLWPSFCSPSALRFLLLCIILPAELGLAWGRLGHQLIAESAAELTPKGRAFWQRHAQELGYLSNVPDIRWKQGSTAKAEAPTHWFHLDVYTTAPWRLPAALHSYQTAAQNYGTPTVIANGTGLWRVEQLYQLASKALALGQYQEALELAGVMAHYVGDLAQPLHVSEDFDGRNGAKTGIHSFFETANLKSLTEAQLKEAILSRAAKLLEEPGFRSSLEAGTSAAIQHQMSRAATKIDQVLSIDETWGRSANGANAQLELALERLADATATLAWFLAQIWENAGRPPLSKKFPISDPEWIAPDYGDTWQSFSESEAAHPAFHHDCSQ